VNGCSARKELRCQNIGSSARFSVDVGMMEQRVAQLFQQRRIGVQQFVDDRIQKIPGFDFVERA
jgi:hypothetical protein